MWTAFATLLLVASADDANMSVRMETNAPNVLVGESFQVDVILTLQNTDERVNFTPPDVSAFDVEREQRNQSQRINVVNGRRSTTTEYRFTYQLRADEPGDKVLDGASATRGTEVVRAAPLTIHVTGQGAVDNAAVAPVGAQPGARFGKRPPSAFLELEVDKPRAVVGEQVTATLVLYAQDQLAQWPQAKPLKPAGFLSSSLLGDDRQQATVRTIAGKPYRVYVLQKDALFPLAPGKKTLSAPSLDIAPFGSFFGPSRATKVSGTTVDVDIEALPSEGRPAQFVAGNVGSFQLEARVEPASVSLGDPFTLRLTATGHGNLDQLTLPTWSGTADVRVFPPTTRVERRDVDGTVAGSVVQEILVQPKVAGSVHVPAFTLITFDPVTRSYATSTTAAIDVVVHRKGNAADTAGDEAPRARQDIGRSARGLKTVLAPEAAVSDAPVVGGGAVAVVGGVVAAGLWLRRRRGAAPGARRAEAHKARARRWQDAAARKDAGAAEEILWECLDDVVGGGSKSVATEALAAHVQARGLPQPLASRLVDVVRALEAARYAPGATAHAGLWTQAEALWRELEAQERAS